MIAEEGRPYTNEDFDKLEPIHGGTTVDQLICRFRDEFGLDKLNDFVKSKVAESLVWLPANGMPIGAVENPASQKITRTPLVAPASVRLAVAMFVRDVILPAMAAKVEAEPTDKPARTKKETV